MKGDCCKILSFSQRKGLDLIDMVKEDEIRARVKIFFFQL